MIHYVHCFVKVFHETVAPTNPIRWDYVRDARGSISWSGCYGACSLAIRSELARLANLRGCTPALGGGQLAQMFLDKIG